MNKIKVVVISGGISTEHEVSIKSGEMVFENLDREKYEVEKAVIAKDGIWKFSFDDGDYAVDEALKMLDEKKFDIAYLALHGEFGEDGQIQRLLDGINLKFTGSSAEASERAMDKAISNEIYKDAGLNVAEYQVLKSVEEEVKIDLPYVVKPNGGGSSVGTSIVKEADEVSVALKSAFATAREVMIQKFVKGREFTCGVLDRDGKSIALPPTEIIPLSSKFFDYEAKYSTGGSREVTPPEIEADKIAEMQEIALKAHEVLGCRGVTRTDFILSEDKFYILETNTIPGMTATSLIPQEARAMGLSNSELLDLIIEASLS